MKQALQLRLGQHLTMTPQLQQAIRLLQLSTLELQTEIQEALDSNLMLEIEEESSETDNSSNNESTPSTEEETPVTDDSGETLSETSASGESEIPEDLPVDSSWDDIYDNIAAPSSSSTSSASDNREYEFSGNTEESLHQHLNWQMQLTPFSDTDRAIAEFIIDAINDDGYLSISLEDIHQALGNDLEIDLDEIEAVMHRIQNFDPPGVGARDLKENQLIQSLNPRPGSQITASQPEYIIPDVIVSKNAGKWKVELNPDAAPRLRVNPHYANLIKQVKDNKDNTCLKNHLQEARWFIKSLISRNETLLRVATSIVERQIDFLERGDEAMKALVLHDIAEAVGMHESTISRVTSKKYMHTPRGIFELKYFFSSHVSTSNGGECSATAIRAFIKKLIATENTNKPLSDSKLATILGEQGINVARRTVAKYREAMAIPPSNERKRLA
jgi:RNA polymerase sigma-54 factor